MEAAGPHLAADRPADGVRERRIAGGAERHERRKPGAPAWKLLAESALEVAGRQDRNGGAGPCLRQEIFDRRQIAAEHDDATPAVALEIVEEGLPDVAAPGVVTKRH